ncbi:MAG TPA: PH domain-containing protein [Myxococcota bacterium]|nr:PH domain-containing protein [Myxococcota bacterium]
MLWSELKLRVGARASGVELRGATGTRTIPRASILGLKVEVSEIWDTVRVMATTRHGPVGLVAKTDRSVLRDPDYDEDSLVRDTYWVTSFAEAVADKLGVPLELAEELR